MEKVKAMLPAFSELNMREKVLMIVCAALVIALIAACCVSINMRVNMQREYTRVRNNIGDALYANLYMLAQTFDMTSVPNADIQNSIMPQMRNYFVAATTLNDLLSKCYGQRYRVMTDADISAVNTAFSAYETAFRNAAPTDLAQADMQTCMTMIRELLSARFSEGTLRASR